MAEVPPSEDVGIDALCIIASPEGSRVLRASGAFFVQLKSASVSHVDYEGEEVRWLESLELPLLIGRVDRHAARIALYSCQRLSQVLIESIEYPCDRIELHIDKTDDAHDPQGTRKANLGEPILEWGATDVRDHACKQDACAVLQAHVANERRNIITRRVGLIERFKWSTGELPISSGTCVTGTALPGARTELILQELAPFLLAWLMDAYVKERWDEYAHLKDAVQYMRNQGVDPDPGRILESLFALSPWARSSD